MYYGSIADEQVKVFHRTVKLTASYGELNGLASGALFDKTKTNKLIPKFYSDKITANDNVTILDDLLVIYMANGDLDSLYFHSVNENFEFDVLYEFFRVSSTVNMVSIHFYDRESLFALNGFSFNITNTSIGLNEDATTDKYGNVLLKIKNTTGTFTVTGNNGQTLTFGGS